MWRDVSHVLARRWPLVRVVLVAAAVQGEDAPASIVSAFRRVERYAETVHAAGRPDDAPAVTILARGGGSLEDLWAFNDERVVRAVVAHPWPVVCGVGHEVDVTLADFAADVRAPTPSAAAEVVVPDQADMAAALRRAADRLAAATGRRVAQAARDLAVERRALDRVSPASRLAAAREQVGLLFDRGTRVVLARLARERLIVQAAHDALPRLASIRLTRERQRLQAAEEALPRLVAGRLGAARIGRRWGRGGPGRARARGDPGARLRHRPGRRQMARSCATRRVAPPGTRLAVRVARGDLDAVVTEPTAGDTHRERALMDVVVFLLAVAVIAVVGVRIGMLVAPRLSRVMDAPDEDDGDGTA